MAFACFPEKAMPKAMTGPAIPWAYSLSEICSSALEQASSREVSDALDPSFLNSTTIEGPSPFLRTILRSQNPSPPSMSAFASNLSDAERTMPSTRAWYTCSFTSILLPADSMRRSESIFPMKGQSFLSRASMNLKDGFP